MIQTPAAVLEAASRIRGAAPVRVHRIGKPDEDLPTIDQENPMPRGIYERKKPAAKPVAKPEAAPSPKAEKPAKVARKPRAAKAPSEARRFAVWNDGTVVIDTPGCKGTMDTTSVRELVIFVQRMSKA